MLIKRPRSLALGLLVILLALIEKTSVYARQGGGLNKNGLPAAEGKIFAARKKELPSDIHDFAATRKLGPKGRTTKPERKAPLLMNDEQNERVEEKPEISGAANSDGKYDHWEANGNLTVKCKFGVKTSFDSSPKRAMNANGFVDFTADYHWPNRHPPRHN